MVSIYCYLIKYWVKIKHLLSFHVTNNKLKEWYIDNINQKWIINETYYLFDDIVNICNQQYEIQLTFIRLHPKEYNQELHYYPFAVKYVRYVRSCNTLNDLSNEVCVQIQRTM